MNTIEEYQAVVAAIDCGSLTAAARLLGRSLQAVSRAVAQVERKRRLIDTFPARRLLLDSGMYGRGDDHGRG